MQNTGPFTGQQGKITMFEYKKEETGKAESCSCWPTRKHCFVKRRTVLLILWLVEKLV